MNRREFVGAAAGASLWSLAEATWAGIPGESKEAKDRRMAWWREARFGMFIHWGIYAVAAGEWKGKTVPGPGEWIMNTARIPAAEYETLAPRFNPVKFNAAEWVRVAKTAGMKYLVITSKHHDGFCMFDSRLTAYDIMDATPFRRDVLLELSQACAAAGIRFGFYHSILDWHHPDQKKNFPRYVEYMKGQLKELLTNYGPVGSIFFDGEWIPLWDARQGRDLENYVRSFQPQVVINNRIGKRPAMVMLPAAASWTMQTPAGDYETPEQFIPKKPPARDWETCMTMNNSWGYKEADRNWKPAAQLIRNLVDIAGKGGNFLLNVGPTAEGLIPPPSVERLAEMGKWLEKNGESIYGTEAGPLQNLKGLRSTRKPGKIYLHLFDWPAGELEIPLDQPVKRAVFLSEPAAGELPLQQMAGKVRIRLPSQSVDAVVSVIVLEV